MLIFLGGMLFTVVNYLPLIEEETAHGQHSFAKKSGSESEGGEQEDEHKPGQDINFFSEGMFRLMCYEGACTSFVTLHRHYSYLAEGTFNPPPEA